MQKPNYIEVPLHELFILIAYYHAACKSSKVGDLGDVDYNSMLREIEQQSKVQLTYEQLDSLVYHFKQCVVNRVTPGRDRVQTNYNGFLARLAFKLPTMFRKHKSTGEVKLLEFEHD